MTCPNCGYPVPRGRLADCPHCHNPLIFNENEPPPVAGTANIGLVKPSDTTDNTIPVQTEQSHAPPPLSVQPPPFPPPPVRQPTPPSHTCPQCGYVNAGGRPRCEQCGNLLIPQAAPQPPPTLPPPPRRRGLALTVALVVGALLLALALGFIVYRLMQSGSGSGQPEPSPQQSTPGQPGTGPAAELKRVKRSSIEAKASSTLAGDTYVVRNTLDGDPTTAWNSDGDDVGAEARVTLTYRFSEPIELRAIEIFNGYQKSDSKFYANSRVRQLKVSTDTTEQTFNLLDQQGGQSIQFDFGRTSRVKLTVEAVYRDATTEYEDCAISEVAFLRI